MEPLRLSLLLLVGMGLPAVLSITCREPFVPLQDAYCIHVVVTYQVDGTGGTLLKWTEARDECGKLGGHLAVTEDSGKVQGLTHYIDKSFPKTQSEYTYWVGGSNEGGRWTWVTGQPINLRSHVWAPEAPSSGQYTQLAPVAQLYTRRYLVDEGPDSDAPAYICEL